MKRIICTALSIIFFFSVVGCTPESTAAAEYSSFLVSAIGFSQKDGEITAYLEALAINSEASVTEIAPIIYKDSGKSVKQAILNAQGTAPQPLHLGHCATIITDSTVTGQVFDELCEFWKNEEQTSIAAAICFTEKSEDLLSCKPTSTVAVGYEIANLLTEQYSRSGIAPQNRLYELLAARLNESKVFSLPYFKAVGENCLCEGAVIFKNDSPAIYLTPEKTAVFALAAGRLKRGTVFIEDKQLTVKKASSALEFEYADVLKARLTVKVEPINLQNKALLENEIKALFEACREKGIDIFFFADTLAKRQQTLWQKVKPDFHKSITTSNLTVVVE